MQGACNVDHPLGNLRIYHSSIPLKFFFMSRPVAQVQRGFRITGLMKGTNTLVLHSIPRHISRKNIRVYLKGRLSHIAQFFELEDWPLTKEFTELVELPNGLFIFAATVANFVEDENASSPIEQLKIVLYRPTTNIASTDNSPYRHLDTLYLAVLREVFPKIV